MGLYRRLKVPTNKYHNYSTIKDRDLDSEAYLTTTYRKVMGMSISLQSKVAAEAQSRQYPFDMSPHLLEETRRYSGP